MTSITATTDADRISRVVFEYAARIGSAKSTRDLLQLNAGMARDLIGADRCSVWLVDTRTNELWTIVAHGVDELRIPLGQGLVSTCINTNEAIVVNDTAADPRFLGMVDQSSGYVTRSMAVLPLQGENAQVIGALQALNKPGGFSVADAELLRLAAAYCCSALETQRFRQEAEAARRLYHELEIARDVQKKLLPRDPPLVDRLDYAAVCRPAAFVGGDYYDFIALHGGRIAFTLGDVSGKGIAAAVLMASIQTSLRAQMMHSPESLAQSMSDFNSAVHSFSEEDRYSTLFCSVFDIETSRLTYVNAGHTRPMVLRGSGLIRLDSGGFPIGLFEDATYEQATIVLETGDIVLCYSDGLSEAANSQGKQWGEAAIKQLLLRHCDCSAHEIIDHLVTACDSFTASAPQSDDMTAIALRLR